MKLTIMIFKSSSSAIGNPVEGARSAWMPHVKVKDVKGTVRAKAAGAYIMMEPNPKIRKGTVAVFLDPHVLDQGPGSIWIHHLCIVHRFLIGRSRFEVILFSPYMQLLTTQGGLNIPAISRINIFFIRLHFLITGFPSIGTLKSGFFRTVNL